MPSASAPPFGGDAEELCACARALSVCFRQDTVGSRAARSPLRRADALQGLAPRRSRSCVGLARVLHWWCGTAALPRTPLSGCARRRRRGPCQGAVGGSGAATAERQAWNAALVRDAAMFELLYSSGCGWGAHRTQHRRRQARSFAGRSHCDGKGSKTRTVRWAPRRAKRSRLADARAQLAEPGERALFVGGPARASRPRGRARLRAWARQRGLNQRVHPQHLRHPSPRTCSSRPRTCARCGASGHRASRPRRFTPI